MKRLIFIMVFTCFSWTVFAQKIINELTGTYKSVNNKFEKTSSLILLENYRFEYYYILGGCQGVVKGTWKIDKDEIFLINNNEFLNTNINADTTLGVPYYPDLSKVKWKLRKKWIKSLSEIDNGCFREKGKYKKN